MRKIYNQERTMHRGAQKRFYGPDKIYFIVSKTFANFPYFREPIFCDLFIDELKICKKLKHFKLYAFCLVYDHINLLIEPVGKYNISQVMQSIKKETSRDINYVLINSNEGDIPECRLQGKQYSYNLNKTFNVPKLINFRTRFHKKYPDNDWPEFKWQKSFRDHVIRGETDFNNHFDYTVYNFVKHDLPDDWPYTSLYYEELIDG